MKSEDGMQYMLTNYSHGAGCGCKISPSILSSILKQTGDNFQFPELLVGNENRDDAAVLQLDGEIAVVSTTDFFMPIVDDAFDFGRIASVNAISDVYAMGGRPIMAIAILGWPIDKLPPELANQVILGSRSVCLDAGIPLAGGHSIDSPEPIFGLAVTGIVEIKHLKRNGGAQKGDLIYLTKPLGVGILTTAQKKGLLKPEHQFLARDLMIQPNIIGIEFGKLPQVHAMTDVTGFGLLGHLSEMCEASDCSALLNWNEIPLIDKEVIHHYLNLGCVPGGSVRNWKSYGHKMSEISELQQKILCDPQTSGGLLVAIDPQFETGFVDLCRKFNLDLHPIGICIDKSEKWIEVN
ncbi:MAG: selenide, water dikinase SelD [Saprospiraceae bacterium]|nr:selenide, water dikinase SelD [Saprospiraceae bacterium]